MAPITTHTPTRLLMRRRACALTGPPLTCSLTKTSAPRHTATRLMLMLILPRFLQGQLLLLRLLLLLLLLLLQVVVLLLLLLLLLLHQFQRPPPPPPRP